MASRYGHAWVSQYGPQPQGFAGAEWRETLCGLTPDQIRDGFDGDVLRGDAWPPSSTMFRTMCLSIPILAVVGLQIRKGEVTSGFARMVRANLDGYRFKQVAAREADRMLADAYNIARESVLGGEKIPDEVLALGVERDAMGYVKRLQAMHTEYCVCEQCESARMVSR